MPVKPINTLTDGVFADWEVLNSLINNVNAVNAQIPGIYLDSYQSPITFTNKEFSGARGANLALNLSPMAIECGYVPFSNVGGNIKYITINTKLSGVAPIPFVSLFNNANARVFATSNTPGRFTIGIENKNWDPGSNKVSGGVCWMVISAGTS